MPEQIQPGSLAKGDYILADDEPCKIKTVKKSAPGKHGHAKYKIRAVGIFDGQSRNMVKKGGSKMLAPTVNKKIGQIVSQDGDIAQVMDMDTYQTDEMKIPSDLDVSEGEEINFWEIEGRKKVKGKNS